MSVELEPLGELISLTEQCQSTQNKSSNPVSCLRSSPDPVSLLRSVPDPVMSQVAEAEAMRDEALRQGQAQQQALQEQLHAQRTTLMAEVRSGRVCSLVWSKIVIPV